MARQTELWTAGEAARHLGITRAAVHLMAKNGTLAVVRVVGASRWRLFDPAAVRKLAQQRAKRKAAKKPSA
jgi:DNA-binding transcriptional MerR regulator